MKKTNARIPSNTTQVSSGWRPTLKTKRNCTKLSVTPFWTKFNTTTRRTLFRVLAVTTWPPLKNKSKKKSMKWQTRRNTSHASRNRFHMPSGSRVNVPGQDNITLTMKWRRWRINRVGTTPRPKSKKARNLFLRNQSSRTWGPIIPLRSTSGPLRAWCSLPKPRMVAVRRCLELRIGSATPKKT